MTGEIPDHVSPARRMLADGHGGESVAYVSEESGGAAIRYEGAPAGIGIAGGMGGGAVTEDIWVHDECVALGLAEQIRAVVRGERERIEPPA